MPLKETIRGFGEILDGKHDDLPEQAFYMVGTIDEAVEAAKGEGGRQEEAKPAKAQAKAESKAEPKAESKAEPKAESKAEPKAESKAGQAQK